MQDQWLQLCQNSCFLGHGCKDASSSHRYHESSDDLFGRDQPNNLESTVTGMTIKQFFTKVAGNFEDIVDEPGYICKDAMVDPLKHIIRCRFRESGYQVGVVDMA